MADTKLEKAKPFRWLGEHGPMNDRKGDLHIQRPDGDRRIIFPGKLVKDSVNLEALGARRVDEFVKEGKAEYLDALEKLGIGEVSQVQTDALPGETETAENAAATASSMNASFRAIAENRAAAGLPPDSRTTGESLGVAGRVQAQAPAPDASDLLGGAAGPRV
jgi:hypothetical protein